MAIKKQTLRIDDGILEQINKKLDDKGISFQKYVLDLIKKDLDIHDVDIVKPGQISLFEDDVE